MRGMAVLLTFDELRDLYGMTNIRPDQRRQIEFLLETAEEEVCHPVLPTGHPDCDQHLRDICPDTSQSIPGRGSRHSMAT